MEQSPDGAPTQGVSETGGKKQIFSKRSFIACFPIATNTLHDWVEVLEAVIASSDSIPHAHLLRPPALLPAQRGETLLHRP